MKLKYLVEQLAVRTQIILNALTHKQQYIGIAFLILISVIAVIGYLSLRNKAKTAEITYQTEKAEIGTLIKSIDSTGTISSGNSSAITTAASGTVKAVYVSNGDAVSKGQKIAEITPDTESQQKRAEAWKKYLDAKEALLAAKKDKVTNDINMWAARQAILDAEESIDYKNNNATNPDTEETYTDSEKTIIDKTLTQAQLAFSEAELKYKNADSEISLASADAAQAFSEYTLLSPIILAPAAGTISNLTLTSNSIVESIDTQSTTTQSSNKLETQEIAQVERTEDQPRVTVLLTESDIVSVQANQKVTLALSAYPDLSFAGKVLAVDTNGTVNSGVTNYSVTIVMEPTSVQLFPNMSVDAQIITAIETNVLLVPSTAITTEGEQQTIQVLPESGVPETIKVTTGDTNGTQTVILSGVTEGTAVITSANAAQDESNPRNSNSSTLFGSSRGFGNFSGGPGGR